MLWIRPSLLMDEAEGSTSPPERTNHATQANDLRRRLRPLPRGVAEGACAVLAWALALGSLVAAPTTEPVRFLPLAGLGAYATASGYLGLRRGYDLRDRLLYLTGVPILAGAVVAVLVAGVVTVVT